MIKDKSSGLIKLDKYGNISIRKDPSFFVYLQLFYVCIVFFLRDCFGLPSFILYFTDVLTILSIVMSIGKIQISIIKAKAKITFNIVIAIILFMCVGALVNMVSPLLFIWGIRNNLRFFAFWLGCITLLREGDVQSIFKLIKIMFWTHIILVTYQYFFMGRSNDGLGGIFGLAQGCNTYGNVFICIITALLFGEYLYNKVNFIKLLIYLVACLYCAALAELKVYYVEFIIAFIIAIITKRHSWKTIILIICGIAVIIFGITLLARFNPESLKFLFESDSLEFYLKGNGYTNSGDLNRFTAIGQINEMFFNNNFFNKLFGFGLGSCDMSSYFASDFYIKYEYLHYRWFTHAWVYLEQGFIGLFLLVFFVISIVLYSNKYRKSIKNNSYLLTTEIFTILTLIGIIYNSALEMEACYLIAFMCAIPFIIVKERK